MNQAEIIIEPGKGIRHYWAEIWRYRELFYFLAWRDILVRYKQTFLGITWSIIRPLLTMMVFTIIFGHLAKFPSDGVPYPILVFSAMLPWQFFANAVTESSNSLIQNNMIISKIYFPRLILPVSSIIVSLVDLFISLGLLVGLMAWYQFLPGPQILLFPLFLLMACAAALGVGFWLSALNVKFRDFRYVIPFFTQLGLYVSPVGFSSSVIPPEWRLLYSLNPMVGIIDGFRWTFLSRGEPLYLPGVLLSLGILFLILYSGMRYFRRTERYFADII